MNCHYNTYLRYVSQVLSLQTSSNGDLKAIIAQKRVGNFWISLNVVPGIFPGNELVVTAFKFTGP